MGIPPAAEIRTEKQGDLWILPVGGPPTDRQPLSFLRTEFEEGGGRFSPDNHWVAYESNQSGKTEIYVLPFDASNPGSRSAGGLHQVSKDGGTDVHWSGNGKELFYLAQDGYLMSVDVNAAGGAFQTGAARRLFKPPGTGRGSWGRFRGWQAIPHHRASGIRRRLAGLAPVPRGGELDGVAEAVSRALRRLGRRSISSNS